MKVDFRCYLRVNVKPTRFKINKYSLWFQTIVFCKRCFRGFGCVRNKGLGEANLSCRFTGPTDPENTEGAIIILFFCVPTDRNISAREENISFLDLCQKLLLNTFQIPTLIRTYITMVLLRECLCANLNLTAPCHCCCLCPLILFVTFPRLFYRTYMFA